MPAPALHESGLMKITWFLPKLRVQVARFAITLGFKNYFAAVLAFSWENYP